MHLEDDGMLPCMYHLPSHSANETTHKTTRDSLCADHGYWTFHMLIVVLKWFSLKEVNSVLAAAPRSTWHDGFAPPPIHPHLLKGAKNKRPKRAGKMRYTASNMRKFAVARFVSCLDTCLGSNATYLFHICFAVLTCSSHSSMILNTLSGWRG
jgi:hypothetical protein